MNYISGCILSCTHVYVIILSYQYVYMYTNVSTIQVHATALDNLQRLLLTCNETIYDLLVSTVPDTLC